MPSMDNIGDRVARAVAAAEETARARAERQAQRADGAYLVADAARRYGLGEDLAARITATSPTEIQREARALALDAARLADDAARSEQPDAPAVRPVSGRASADTDLHDFDPADVLRQVRPPY